MSAPPVDTARVQQEIKALQTEIKLIRKVQYYFIAAESETQNYILLCFNWLCWMKEMLPDYQEVEEITASILDKYMYLDYDHAMEQVKADVQECEHKIAEYVHELALTW
jgi:hypothetical protein